MSNKMRHIDAINDVKTKTSANNFMNERFCENNIIIFIGFVSDFNSFALYFDSMFGWTD